MLYQRYGRIPLEDSSLWGNTTPNRRQDPRASGFSLPKEWNKELIIQEFDTANQGLTELIEFCESLETSNEIIPTQVKWNHQNKKTKQYGERHQYSKSEQSKGSYQAAKPLEEDANKNKEETLARVPSAWTWTLYELV